MIDADKTVAWWGGFLSFVALLSLVVIIAGKPAVDLRWWFVPVMLMECGQMLLLTALLMRKW